ncbi:MAG: tetratricopeptide repeat-containing sensor histidine kinase [Bacteroidota bacterium]
MKSVIGIFFFWAILFVAYSQNNKIDSLKSILEEGEVPGYDKLKIYGQLAFRYRNIDAHKTIEYSKLQLDLANEVNDTKNKAQALRNIGLGYQQIGESDSALIFCDRAIIIAKSNDHKMILGDAYNTVGNVLFRRGDLDSAAVIYQKSADIQKSIGEMGNMAGNLMNVGVILKERGYYSLALEKYNEAREIFENLDIPNGLASVYHSLAGLYEDLDEDEKALEFYAKTNELDVQTGNLVGKAITLNSMSDILLERGDTAKSIQNIHESINLLVQTDSKCRLDVPYTTLGNFYVGIKRLDSAFHYLNKGLNVSRDCGKQQNEVGLLNSLGQAYLIESNLDLALQQAKQAYRISKESNYRTDLSDASQLLFEIYSERNNYRLALKHYLEYDSIQEEIFNDKSNREIARVEAEFEFQKEKEAFEYEREIGKLELREEQRQQKNLIIIFSLVILASLIIVFIVLRYYQLKKKANEDLTLLNEEIKSQNEEIMQQRDQLESSNKKLLELDDEKNRLMSVVAHDLRSPLNQIKGLLKLIDLERKNPDKSYTEYIELASSSAERLSEMVSRILDINAIESGDLKINMQKTDLGEVCATVVKDYKITAENKNITVCEEFKEGESFAFVDANYFIQILQNLISNAIKFSPPDKEVFVCLFNQNDKIKLVIKDQGPGISEEDQEKLFNPFQTLSAKPTAGEDSLGLGLSIVKKYVDEMGGAIHCESELGKGTSFIIEFKQA